jgi:hypothetical protein
MKPRMSDRLELGLGLGQVTVVAALLLFLGPPSIANVEADLVAAWAARICDENVESLATLIERAGPRQDMACRQLADTVKRLCDSAPAARSPAGKISSSAWAQQSCAGDRGKPVR